MTFTNLVPHRSILSPLLLGLESLGIFIKHLDYMNGNRELYRLAENLKQEFMNEIMETKEQGLFVNPNGDYESQGYHCPILLSDGEDISLDSNIEYSMEKEFREEGSL